MNMDMDMDIEIAATRLSSLGNATRLSLFRLLVRAGKEGLNIGEIQKHLDIPPSTLAHHIQALQQTNMVIQKKQGREVINTANYDAMNRLVDFLTEHCCQGVAAECEKNESC